MKEYHPLFQKRNNQMLLAVSARKIIKRVAIGGIIWGILNTTIGVFAVMVSIVNIGLVLLGLLMLGVGVLALVKPSRHTLLLEAIASGILVCWNIGIGIYNAAVFGGTDRPISFIAPLVVAITFTGYYRKLKPVEGAIATLKPELMTASKETCKRLFKIKQKDNDNLIVFTNSKYRLLYEEGQFIFFAKDMSASFIATPEELRELILDPQKKKLRLVIDHPMNKVKIGLNKKRTARLLEMIEAACPTELEVTASV